MILKGILLYVTFIFMVLSICCIDSMSLGILLLDILSICILIRLNYKYISEEEFNILTFSKYLKEDDKDN